MRNKDDVAWNNSAYVTFVFHFSASADENQLKAVRGGGCGLPQVSHGGDQRGEIVVSHRGAAGVDQLDPLCLYGRIQGLPIDGKSCLAIKIV